MSYRISKDFAFSASHQLHGLPFDHPCSRLHGHNYVLRIVLEGDNVNEVGFLVDYRSLSPVKDWVDDHLDHRHLNDVFDFNPTSENICCYVHSLVGTLVPLPAGVMVEVSLSETPKTWATYRAGGVS